MQTMLTMAWSSWTPPALALALVAFVFVLTTLLWKTNTKSKILPPGPRGLPIFGNLFVPGKHPQRDLHRLSQTYGPIMYLQLGFAPAIVVSSPNAAKLFLKTYDLNFASRAQLEVAKHLGYEQKNLIFAQYGSYWRTMRKMCTLELLTNLKINSFKTMRKEELDLLIEHIKEAARDGVAVDLSAKVSSLSAGMTCRMIFGKKYLDKDLDGRGFKAVIQEALKLLGTPNLADYFPQIASLDLQGLTKRTKAVAKVLDAFLEKIINEHIHLVDENRNKDFVDVLLGFMGSEETEYRIGREHIKANILDMLMAATDTSATAIEWALSELMRHPKIIKKLQKELEEKVGLERMAEESDLESLEYLHMVVKETLRLHPVAPLLGHESLEDCTVNGFYIPKKSRIIINLWAIGRDPCAWADAEKFFPERFVGKDIDLNGRDFQLLPFGSGRRGCPGMHLALTIVKSVLAQLVHCFDWELPNYMSPTELDMTEEFSLVTPRAEPLLAIPNYRLHS
ncbi:p450 domain-containing protein [Cephalotus follicularis]|uniref:p450 domain-containing protein n=1 Tax=Cephalotus follicularis TaxID=3775 RepID=A0A1Q3BUT9_CEPFO|nr:p450 domain-containing protein [Cephalotus follicularis]